MKLGGWVRKQRFDYKSNKLQNMKIRLLENTFHDWSWDVLKDSWDTNFEIMKQYCEEFKTALVKDKKKYKGIRLGTWVSKQRKNYKKGKLSKEQINKLAKLENWSWDPLEEQWNNGFSMAKKFYNEFKTIRTSVKTVYKDFKIGRWVHYQRRAYKKLKLSPEKIKKIEMSFKDWLWIDRNLKK